MIFETLFQYCGLLTACFYLLQLFQSIYPFIRASSLPRYLRRPNSWALITGASSGIGFGFAQELCSRGFNVIIHGRNRTKLERLKADLQRQFPDRSIRIAVADAMYSDVAGSIKDIVSSLQDVHLTVLINNIGGIAGIVSPQFKTLARHTAEEIDATIKVNDVFATHITGALLPLLQKNQPSLVMNIGSVSARLIMPYLSVYSAAKAYNEAFNNCLAAEMRAEGHDIEVLGIIVGSVRTEGRGSDISTSFFTPSARVMAKAALEKVGCGRNLVPGYLPHALQISFMGLVPEVLAKAFLEKEMRQLKANAEMDAKAR